MQVFDEIPPQRNEQDYPEIFAGIKQRIAEGRWIVADGWCEYDQTMPSGESMIRQHLLGSRYAREELGCEISLAWDDPTVGIEWPIPGGEGPQLSEKDRNGSAWGEIPLL